MSGAAPLVTLVGAGPTGALLAILLRRRGFRVVVYEARPDPRRHPEESGRSINLALGARGIRALERVEVLDRLRAGLVRMRGRCVHERGGRITLQPYGTRPDETIYSISRAALGRLLLDVAVTEYGVDVRFEHRLEAIDWRTGHAVIGDSGGHRVEVPMRPLIACDGAGSRVRRCLAETHRIDAREEPLEHGYKELSIPATATGHAALLREALHIWPRGDHMLIALPNDDGSFTATLFLRRHGSPSFESLADERTTAQFFDSGFPDVAPLMPQRTAEWRERPVGFLGTVRATPWHHRDQVVLVGDAAHAVVPFHGQGMNCCFEDCLALDECIAAHPDWESRFAAFYAQRKPNADAIAAMSLENYAEMRAKVVDPQFQVQSALAHELERRLPDRFIPRYSMVMFHPEIPYQVAERRGRVQARLLAALSAHASSLADIDLDAAQRIIEAELVPLAQDLSSVTKV